MFLKEEKICYKMVYDILHITLYIFVKPIVRNRVEKFEITQMKNRLFIKGLGT